MYLTFLKSIAAIAMSYLLVHPAQASYPCSRVTLVVPFGPGQTSAVAQAISEQLQRRLAVTVTLESHPGAGGSIGTSVVVRARADGCTLLFGASSALILPFTANKPYDAQRDLRPIAFTIEAAPPLLITRKGVVADFAEFAARARAQPGVLNIGVNNRTLAHLAGAQLFAGAKLAIQFVPHRSENDAINQLVGGHLDYVIVLAPTALGLIQAQTAHPLVQITGTRNRFLPDIPSAADLGITGTDFRVYNSLFVPAGTPDSIVETLVTAVDDMRKDPDFIARLSRQASVPMAGGPREVGEWLASTSKEWSRIVEQNGFVRE